MILLVCGGRHYHGKERLWQVLDDLHSKHRTRVDLLVHGDCPTGADAMADGWANYRGVDRIKCPANWEGHGKAAGPLRNRNMLLRFWFDMVLVFPGGPGTKNMLMQALNLRAMSRPDLKIVEIDRELHRETTATT